MLELKQKRPLRARGPFCVRLLLLFFNQTDRFHEIVHLNRTKIQSLG